MNIEGEEEQGGLKGGMRTRQNISAPVPEKPKLSERVSTHRLHKRKRCLIALTFRNLTYKKMAISGKPGGVGWDGTHKADRSSHLRGGTLPSQVSYCPASFTYTFGLCSGNSIDSPSLSRRTVARSNHPAHNGVPLPGAGWRDTEVPQRTLWSSASS